MFGRTEIDYVWNIKQTQTNIPNKCLKQKRTKQTVCLTFNEHFVRNVRNKLLYGMFGMFETVKNKMTNVRNNLEQIIKILFGMFGIV